MQFFMAHRSYDPKGGLWEIALMVVFCQRKGIDQIVSINYNKNIFENVSMSCRIVEINEW